MEVLTRSYIGYLLHQALICARTNTNGKDANAGISGNLSLSQGIGHSAR